MRSPFAKTTSCETAVELLAFGACTAEEIATTAAAARVETSSVQQRRLRKRRRRQSFNLYSSARLAAVVRDGLRFPRSINSAGKRKRRTRQSRRCTTSGGPCLA